MLRVPACHGPWPVCASCPWGRDSCSLSTAAAVHDDGGRVLKAGSQRTNKDRRHSGILAWAQRRLIFLAHGSRVDLARRPALAMATPRRGITARWEGNGFVLLSPIRRSVFGLVAIWSVREKGLQRSTRLGPQTPQCSARRSPNVHHGANTTLLDLAVSGPDFLHYCSILIAHCCHWIDVWLRCKTADS